ncbi:MAG TPA: hypothetical protein ENI90_03775 [Methylothermaceae bacterium]|nr:hypothetical protein [Methylothermaceae bacterium]
MATERDCVLCRVMRAMAFSGLGAAIAGFAALYLFGASKQNALLAAVVGAAILVFGLGQRQKDRGD